MKKYAIDTQALIKFMQGKKVINNKVDSILRRVDEGKDMVIIPSAVIFEIGYLHERERIPISL